MFSFLMYSSCLSHLYTTTITTFFLFYYLLLLCRFLLRFAKVQRSTHAGSPWFFISCFRTRTCRSSPVCMSPSLLVNYYYWYACRSPFFLLVDSNLFCFCCIMDISIPHTQRCMNDAPPPFLFIIINNARQCDNNPSLLRPNFLHMQSSIDPHASQPKY